MYDILRKCKCFCIDYIFHTVKTAHSQHHVANKRVYVCWLFWLLLDNGIRHTRRAKHENDVKYGDFGVESMLLGN